MNAQTQTVHLQLEGYQMEEAVMSIFHTVLINRTCGKFHYQPDGKYLEACMGFKDIDCNFIDLTYVRCSSPELDQNIHSHVAAFCDELRNSEHTSTGEISLKFLRKEKAMWPFQMVCIPWEIWNVQLELIHRRHCREQQVMREQIGELLAEKIVSITEVMNKSAYVPEVPSEPADLCLVFDVSYEDCQPYLYEIEHTSPKPSSPSFKNILRTMFR